LKFLNETIEFGDFVGVRLELSVTLDNFIGKIPEFVLEVGDPEFEW
jgi:hypothetical protein